MVTYSAEFLISVAESANIPATSYELSPWRTFPAANGWQVMVYYDVDEFDYIEHFITPDGTIIEIWEWPESEEKKLLTSWREDE